MTITQYYYYTIACFLICRIIQKVENKYGTSNSEWDDLTKRKYKTMDRKFKEVQIGGVYYNSRILLSASSNVTFKGKLFAKGDDSSSYTCSHEEGNTSGVQNKDNDNFIEDSEGILSKLKKNKLIIRFKKEENMLTSTFRHNFVNVLVHCGRVKKLSYINFYLFDIFPNVDDTLLKICLLSLFNSKNVLVELDFQILPIEKKSIKMKFKEDHHIDISNQNKSRKSNCCNRNMFHLHSKVAFRKFLHRLQNNSKGTNIFNGYDKTKMKEGTEISAEYEVHDVNVCIVDTGIDYNHRDLKENIIHIRNKRREGEVEEDSDRNQNGNTDMEWKVKERKGKYEDVEGFMDNHGHGTFIAGIIAGNSGKNNQGIRGISKKAKLIICKALNSKNAGYISDILKCFNFCAEKKAKIINASFASSKNYPSLFAALKELEEKKILVVSSSGNCCPNMDFSNNTFNECDLDVTKVYPTAYSLHLTNLITVSNMIQESNGNIILSPDSCYSKNYVHLAAPGNDIISTFPQNKYAISSGSSFSAAVITGLASLVLSINDKLTYEDVIHLFQQSIVQTKSLQGRVKWGGFLNVHQLIKSTIEN
ncbi:subtilisin-like serine protease [Plasmodium gonderi]|uniref:subtilisin n=1 Tax=Plasmodium gonderi TaxID=77519 RepID=A0A1Y1JM70_PLAGO|nr:subtilisin-like serine protease [Plasmodium gonderi]GAW81483.1 subtilisin-like serine protease [Plasmodium gonderi]